MVGILGKKVGMTQIFVEDGNLFPVTVIEAGPCWVVQKKEMEKDGYSSIQIGYQKAKEKKTPKPSLGHMKNCPAGPLKYLREIRVDAPEEYELGQELTVDVFSPGDLVNIAGITKGKGFAGVIKRHGFSGGKKSHGSMFHRAPGSIGQSSYPSRVFKGKKLPGRMGCDRKTIKNVMVLRVDKEKNLLIVKGSVPGGKNGLLMIVNPRQGDKSS